MSVGGSTDIAPADDPSSGISGAAARQQRALPSWLVVSASKLFGMLATILVASFIIYASLYLTPGNPVVSLVGPKAPPEVVTAVEAKYHLNDPFIVAYWHWLTGVLGGDFGTSFVHHQPVSSLLAPRLGTTALLVAMAALWTVLAGVTMGLLAGLKGGRIDFGLTTLATIGIAIPSFVAAVVFITIFSVELGWFPVFGAGSGSFDRLYHLFLPSIALAISSAAYVSRITRASIIDEKTREHVEMARGRGLSERAVIRRHVLRNAMIPITTVVGISIAGLIAATVIVEVAFGLGGLGSLLVGSVQQKDFAVVQAISLILVVAFIVVNAAVDLLYALIDPRISARRG
jgi:peptide/nickel transport system permease protein